jgi:RNA polymerase primary sigma factor
VSGSPAPRSGSAGDWTGLDLEVVIAAKDGGAAARAELIEAALPLIGRVARGYAALATVERSELMQEGVAGLLQALERYEPARGRPFWAYACWWVRQGMQQLVSQLSRPVVLSDRAARKLARVRAARSSLLQAEGREPSIAELADNSGLAREQVEQLLAVERPARSLYEPPLGGEGDGATVGEQLVDPQSEDGYERAAERLRAESLTRFFLRLDETEKTILRGRFGFDGASRTLGELGRALDLSSERIRQIQERALNKLRSAAALPGGAVEVADSS